MMTYDDIAPLLRGAPRLCFELGPALARAGPIRAHPVRGESHIQRNANREVATTSLLFTTNRTDRTFFM